MANQNLYQNNPTTNSNNTASGTISNQGVSWTDKLSQNLDSWIININYFFLAWAIFYTIILLVDFWYYRVRQHGFYSSHKQGEESLAFAQKMWGLYFIWLILITIYAFIPGTWAMILGIILIIGALVKFFVFDLAKAPLFVTVFEWLGGKVASGGVSGFSKIFAIVVLGISTILGFFKDIILGVVESVMSIFTHK